MSDKEFNKVRGFAGGPCDIDIPSTVKRAFIPEGEELLNFKVVWQSLDGRPEHKYYGTYADAEKHMIGLIKLGRDAHVWGRIPPPQSEE